MLTRAEAKQQARERLSSFIGRPRSEDMLLELSEEINTLLDEWATVGYYVTDEFGIPIQSVDIYTDEEDFRFIRVAFIR